MSNFTMDPDWLVYHQNPSVPTFQLPAGAVDAHCHVFGPGDEFPYAKERKYTPCDAGKEALWSLRDHLGFSRNVIVQATCHGADNSAMTDALLHSNGMARGVATVRATVTDEELQSLHDAGVRGVRFNFVKRLVNVTPEDQLRSIASRIAPLGWHLVIYFEAPDLEEYIDFFTSLPAPVVFDHMGRPDVTKAVSSEQFQRFVSMMRSNETLWTKVTCPERLSVSGPPVYKDFIPFAKHLVEEFPDRVIWGTDWPHPNLKSHMPDDAHLVDIIPKIAVAPKLQHKLLVENPMRLYWPELV